MSWIFGLYTPNTVHKYLDIEQTILCSCLPQCIEDQIKIMNIAVLLCSFNGRRYLENEFWNPKQILVLTKQALNHKLFCTT